MKILIVIISLLVDLILSNVISTNSYLAYLYPMFTLTSLVFISNYYSNPNRKNYYMFILFVSILYDSLFMGNLLISITSFMLIGILNIFLKRHLSNNLFNNILRIISSVVIYEIFILTLLFIVGYRGFDINIVLYKIIHSMLLNIIYMMILFLVLKQKKA